MKVTDYIAKELYRRGVRSVFELSGGMITHLLNSLSEAGNIRVVSVHHEQAAAFAADATGRLTGIPGIAMATSGPGATNLLTGIGSCYFDSSPAVFITGQVNRWELKSDRQIRQLGFQETDIVQMARPITKAAIQITSADEIPARIDEAFDLATHGRPGPVLLDIPMDVQRANVDEHPSLDRMAQFVPQPASINSTLESLLEAIRGAQRPLVLAGGGVRAGQSADAFHRFIEKTGIPVVHSLMAVDLLPFHHPLRVGMIGTYGNRWANLALAQSDLLIVVGSRLDVRQTGSDVEFLRKDRIIFHVDCEAGEINNRVTGCQAIHADIRDFLEQIERAVEGQIFPDRAEWLKSIAALRSKYPDEAEIPGITGINPNTFIHQLSAASHRAATYVVDVGQHQMWAAQSTEIERGQRWITSGGMGSMGFALPAAIGAAFATGLPTLVIAGDGAFQCNIQELQTIVRNRLPIKIVIINNRCHGMVRQFQQSYFHERYHATLWGYDTPDFVKVAAAYGLTAGRAERPDQVKSCLEQLWEDPDVPALLEIAVDTFANVYPKIAFGLPLNCMEPEAEPVAMEGT